MNAAAQSKSICLCVTGGIASYKAAHLTSRLTQAGIQVHVAMTPAATGFVGTSTFLALSGNPVHSSVGATTEAPYGAHIHLATHCDVLAVVPATANFLAKAAHGLADCIASATYSAFDGDVFLAPAMNSSMWSNPATQRNLQQLADDGCQILAPEEGWLSCRQQGTGRLQSISDILSTLHHCCNP